MSVKPTDLWEFAEQVAFKSGSGWEYVLDPIGLIHYSDFPRYDATPMNLEVFAATGGNGTHFGILDSPGNPVVMVVPMSIERAHTVVGGTFHEFLRLGCKCGYFGLEQLAYDWNGTIEWIKDTHVSTQHPTETKLLDALMQRFELEPIPDPHKRLKEWRREHRDRIIVDGESNNESDG